MKIENTDNITMKMKLNPELSCLEAQEKFWRGRFKEIEEKFMEERRKMEVLLLQITTENERLKNDLHKLTSNLPTRSISVQTSPIESGTDAICKYCQVPLVKTRTIFLKNSSPSDKNIEQKENNSEFLIDDDLSLCENSTSTQVNDTDDTKRIDIEMTIKKLFATNDHSDSRKITSKLLELYEKRSKSVPDLVYDETDYENLLQDENKLIAEDHSDRTQNEISEKNEEISSNTYENPIVSESTRQYVKTSKHTKNKSRFFPSVQNIRKKVFKNISKIRRTCTDVKMANDKLKTADASCSNSMSSDVTNEQGNNPSELVLDKERTEGKGDEMMTLSPKYQLTSALKKSKSTGNIVKKVAFCDDLLSMKTVSESNLLQVVDYRKPQLVGSVQVHRDRFNRPIPAPRSRKNIIIV